MKTPCTAIDEQAEQVQQRSTRYCHTLSVKVVIGDVHIMTSSTKLPNTGDELAFHNYNNLHGT